MLAVDLLDATVACPEQIAPQIDDDNLSPMGRAARAHSLNV
jgi:hypothetical protein